MPVEFVDLHGPEWGPLMFTKLQIVHHLLRLGRSLLYSDTDVVFLRDPLSYLQEETKDYDLSIQYHGHGMVCAGFYYIKPTARAMHLVDVLRDDTRKLSEVPKSHVKSEEQVHCDNPLINRRLATRAYNGGVSFPNARYNMLLRDPFPDRIWWKKRTPEEAYVVHFNCLVGKDSKIKEMRKYRMWYQNRTLPSTST